MPASPGEDGLPLENGLRIDAVVPARVVRPAVASRGHERAAVLPGERGQHPQRRQVHDHVGVRLLYVPAVALVEGPVGVPAAAVVARVVDDGGGVGDPEVLPQQSQAETGEPGVGEVRGEGLAVTDQPGDGADVGRRVPALLPVPVDGAQDVGAHRADFGRGNHPFEETEPSLCHLAAELIVSRILHGNVEATLASPGWAASAVHTCSCRNSGAKSAPLLHEGVCPSRVKDLKSVRSFNGSKTSPYSSDDKSTSPATPSLNDNHTL